MDDSAAFTMNYTHVWIFYFEGMSDFLFYLYHCATLMQLSVPLLRSHISFLSYDNRIIVPQAPFYMQIMQVFDPQSP